MNPLHVDLVAKSGHLVDEVEAERPSAGDLDRRRLRGERAQRRARCRRLRPAGGRRRGRLIGELLQVQPLQVFELELLDAADVRSFLVAVVGSQARQELDFHLPPAARVRSPVEINVALAGDPLFAEIDVAGAYQQVVLMVRSLATAADRHRPAEFALDQRIRPRPALFRSSGGSKRRFAPSGTSITTAWSKRSCLSTTVSSGM